MRHSARNRKAKLLKKCQAKAQTMNHAGIFRAACQSLPYQKARKTSVRIDNLE